MALRLQTLKRRKNQDGTPGAPVWRLVPVKPDLLGYLSRHARWHRFQPADRYWPWCVRHAHGLIARAMLAAGVPRERAHPHAIRHGHAIAAVKAGVPLAILQAQLGHSSIQTTAIYLQFTLEDRKQAYKGVF